MRLRALIGAGLLLLAFAVSLGAYCLVVSRGERLIEACGTVLSSEEERLPEAADGMLRLWEKDRRLFFSLLKHGDADGLSLQFGLLRTAIGEGDANGMREAAAQILAQMRVILEGETPGIGNLF